jgi:hypothetical protein
VRSHPLAPAVAALLVLLINVAPVFAHEHRRVGGYEFVVGWVEEPTYAGFMNGVQVRLTDETGRPVDDLGDSLKVEVIYGKQRTEAAALFPAFGATVGRPGDYRMSFIPTRPGTYTFHLTGTIRGHRVDESFTASERTFDLVRASSEVEFPERDPTRAELATRIQRMAPRLDKANETLELVNALAVAGLGVGGLGLIVALIAVRNRRSQ